MQCWVRNPGPGRRSITSFALPHSPQIPGNPSRFLTNPHEQGVSNGLNPSSRGRNTAFGAQCFRYSRILRPESQARQECCACSPHPLLVAPHAFAQQAAASYSDVPATSGLRRGHRHRFAHQAHQRFHDSDPHHGIRRRRALKTGALSTSATC